MADPALLDTIAQQTTNGRVQRWADLAGQDLLDARILAKAYDVDPDPVGENRNPQIISGKVITRDENGNVVAEQVPGLEPRVNVSIQQTQPVSTTAALTLDDIRTQVQASGGQLIERGGVYIATFPDRSQVRYDPTGFPRAGLTTYNPTYVAPSATATGKPTVADVVGGALKGLGIGGDSAQPSPAPAPAPAPVNLAEEPAPAGPQVFRRLPTPGQELLGQQGPVDLVRLPTAGGGSRDINRDTVNMGLAASGLTPTGDFEKDFRTWGNEQGKRAVLQAMNPDMDAARIQSAFFQPAMKERESMRNQRVADLLTALDLSRDPTDNVSYTDEYMDERLNELGVMGMAQGGTVTTGSNWLSAANARADDLYADNRDRQARMVMGSLEDRGLDLTKLGEDYTGQLYRQPGTGAMVPPWLLPAYNPRGGGYGPGLGSFLNRITDSPIPGQSLLTQLPREREAHESYTGNAVNSFPNAGVTPRVSGATRSYVPRFAGGGSMMVDEPITAYGDYSQEPKFTMGEPNALTGGMPTREVLNVTPLEPSVPMSAQPAPMPTRQPTQNDVAVLANVVHMMMGRRGKKAAYHPAPLGGY